MSEAMVWLSALLMAILLAAVPVLFDSPTELDAAVVTAADLNDAIHTAAAAAKDKP